LRHYAEKNGATSKIIIIRHKLEDFLYQCCHKIDF
jgi:hypothetical protein